MSFAAAPLSTSIQYNPFSIIMSLRSRSLQFRNFDVTFPDERVVQVTLNRPEKLNCIDTATSREIAEIWEHFDRDESLWVGVITGVGRAFCTGADLHGRCLSAWLSSYSSPSGKD